MDGQIDLAIGMSSKSKLWKNKKYQWSDLVKQLSEARKTTETFKEYINASKDDQSKIKDVGGFVGGYLRNGRRKPENVVHRQLLTLDIDFAHGNFWGDFTMLFDCAAVLHGTHKFSIESPRYRLLIPLSREVSPDEYVAVSRKVAGDLNIELFDNTTFEPNRLMYWPSSPKDIDYYFQSQEGNWLNPDEILKTYIDWKDSSLWPTADKQFQKVKANFEKQQDPEEKKGIVGAFCRTFKISEAIEKYLSDCYTPTIEGRYTYAKGTTASGMITYDDKFAFSHHGTDPSGGILCNAFDLVRIHKFGHLDREDDKLKSYNAMTDFARSDKQVKKIIASENITEAKYDFAVDDSPSGTEPPTEINIEWMSELEIDGKGKYLSSAQNLNLIFAKDARLQGVFKQNDFDGKKYIFKTTPWRKLRAPEPVKNVDFSGVRNYLESIYEMVGTLKVDDAMALEFERNSFHPVREYLNGLRWDGENRVDTLLIDYLGAANTIYTKEAIRKMLVGAVARVMHPGVKFDLVLVIVGPQGTGKSTLVKKLGQGWFSDTFMTVQGKEALEQIQGAWLIEMAELAGLRKGEVESIKHFISKQEDTFRPAYGRTSETYKRQCVFFGTTNAKEFLSDPSGNRRFIPIDINKDLATKDIFSLADSEVDQIWAEAVELFHAGETLFMSKEAEKLARAEQRDHSENDERRGLVEAYLETLLPGDWEAQDTFARRLYMSEGGKTGGAVERDAVCIAEIWCECLGKEKENMDRYKTREINDILRTLDGWEQSKSTKDFVHYGRQRYYRRKLC